MLSSETRNVLRFGPFTADLDEQRLWKGNEPILLTPLVFRTLTILMENRDRIVPKDELLNTIWPDHFVEESNLTQNISVLRKALGERDSSTKYIETFPRRGYRFVADAAFAQEPHIAESVPALEVENPSLEHAVVIDVPVTADPIRRGNFGNLLLMPAAILICLVVAAAIGFGSRDAVPLDPIVQRAVTHLPGREFQPAISPDGSRLAFVHQNGSEQPLRVGIVELNALSEPRMISSATEDAFGATWSPDGTSLAYLQLASSELRLVVHGLNGSMRTVADVFPDRQGVFQRQLDWSPDGRFLAVSNRSASDEPFRIDLIHVREGRTIPLTVPPPLSDGDFDPRFSPDGERLAFVRITSRSRMEVFQVSLPAGAPVRVTNNDQPIGGIDWTPDSESLLYSALQSGKSLIFRVAVSNPEHPGIPMPIAATGEGRPVQFAVSRESGEVVTAQPLPDENIWRASIEPNGQVGPWQSWISSTGNDWFPVYSPDGRYVAFLSDRSGNNQIWISDQSGRQRQITTGDLQPSYASWTANNTDVVFSSVKNRHPYRVNINGGEPQEITVEGRVGGHVSVSPLDGSILFARRFYIYRAMPGGGAPSVLTDQGGYPLRFSRDGRELFFTRHRFSGEIWRMDLGSGQGSAVIDRLKPGCWACWSINDQELVYVSREGRTIEHVDLVTGVTRKLGEVPSRLPVLGHGALALSPDGRSILGVVAEAGHGDIQLIDRTAFGAADALQPQARLTD